MRPELNEQSEQQSSQATTVTRQTTIRIDAASPGAPPTPYQLQRPDQGTKAARQKTFSELYELRAGGGPNKGRTRYQKKQGGATSATGVATGAASSTAPANGLMSGSEDSALAEDAGNEKEEAARTLSLLSGLAALPVTAGGNDADDTTAAQAERDASANPDDESPKWVEEVRSP